MKKLIVVLAVIGIFAIIIALSIPAWADNKAYQECLELQQQGYAIDCTPPGLPMISMTVEQKNAVLYEKTGVAFTTDIDDIHLVYREEQATKVEEEKPVTYTVHITIKYNVASEAEASEINRKALAQHGEGSCQLEVKIKKNGDNLNGLVFLNPGNDLYFRSAFTLMDELK